MWESMRPGITVRPCRSITRVCAPACLRISALPPTAVIFPSRIARASWVENWRSTVRIFPFTKMVSAPCENAGSAAARTAQESIIVRTNLAGGIFISRAFHPDLVQTFWRAVFSVPVQRLAAGIHGNGAQFGKVVEGLDAGLAPHAAILKAAPRRSGIEAVMVVHPDHAENELARHAVSARGIASPNGSREAEARIVGDAHCVRLIFKWHDHGYRPKNFVLRDLRARIGIIEHGGLDKIASGKIGGSGLSAGQQFCAVSGGAIEHRENPAARFFRDDRAKLGLRIGRIAEADRCGFGAKPLEEIGVHGALHQNARTAYARLARGNKGGEGGAIHSALHIHVVEYDHRTLAAQLQRGRR